MRIVVIKCHISRLIMAGQIRRHHRRERIADDKELPSRSRAIRRAEAEHLSAILLHRLQRVRRIAAHHIIRAVIQNISQMNQTGKIIASRVAILYIHIFERRKIKAQSLHQPLRADVGPEVVPVRVVLVINIRVRIFLPECHQIIIAADHLQIRILVQIIHNLLHSAVFRRLSVHIGHVFTVNPLFVRCNVNHKITSARGELIPGRDEIRSNLLQFFLSEKIRSHVIPDRILVRDLCSLIEQPAVLPHNHALGRGRFQSLVLRQTIQGQQLISEREMVVEPGLELRGKRLQGGHHALVLRFL